jgi:DNA repair protein RadA/Sms
MAKVKKVFVCQNCGAQHNQWLGQCKSCSQWNTIVEEVLAREKNEKPWEDSGKSRKRVVKTEPIGEISYDEGKRIKTPGKELNRVLGGGVVPGSVVLLGGEPGIGKSTLLLQLALRLPVRVAYISGEESSQQIKMRAERIGITNQDCYILSETNTDIIFGQLRDLEPQLVIVDSIQTMQAAGLESSPGSVSQIRESSAQFIKYAKDTNTPVFLIGHITKEGSLAGPKVLEHMVDVVLQFEGDQHYLYRLIRAHKNRFGATAEIGIYEMINSGLKEVENPSEVLISKKDENLSGTAIGVMTEGARPLLVEIQALVSTAVYGTPQRSSTGFDTRRLNMLLAVLEKRCGFRLGAKDVFLNITGGLRVDDPALDLAVATAILSSDQDIPLNQKACFVGEIGLTGEIRAVSRVEQRIREAEKLGFEEIYLSKYNKVKPGQYAIKVFEVAKFDELLALLFG